MRACRSACSTRATDDFYEKTLREHAGLVNETRKQFELLKPEMFRKIKRLQDGEDFDLDAAIDFIVERSARAQPTADKIYWRRNKIERDVAVAFLLDMSRLDRRRDREAPSRSTRTTTTTTTTRAST